MGDEERQQASSSRENHLEWLRGQRAEYEAHHAHGGPSDDFAVGGAQEVELDESELEAPVYRGLSMMGSSESSLEYEEEPVYRSIDLSKMSMGDSVPSPNADATWVAGKRPPLLRRQNAFKFQDEDPDWLDLLGRDSAQQ
jgi:hypothetical protein